MMDIAVGCEVDAWCTKCSEDKMHVVCARTNGTVQVMCNVCSQSHRYRPPHTVASTRRKPPQTERPQGRAPKDDFSLPPDDSLYKRYDLRESFRVLDLIHHPKFGRGRVVKLLSREKMEVRFGDGRRLLAQNQGR